MLTCEYRPTVRVRQQRGGSVVLVNSSPPVASRIVITTPVVRNPTVASADAGSEDPLVEQTRRHIHQLAREIGELAKSNVAAPTFRQQFLMRMLAATGATAAVWWEGEGANWELVAGLQMDQVGLAAGSTLHQALVRQLAKTPANQLPLCVEPAAIAASAKQTTAHALLMAGFPVQEGRRVVVQLFRRPTESAAAQRGCLDFLARMTELARDYYVRPVQPKEEGATSWQLLDSALRELHRAPDFASRARAIVESASRLLACDRVSLAWQRDGKLEIVAISGAPKLDARSEDIQRLTAVARAAIDLGKPLRRPVDAASRDAAECQPLSDLLAKSKTRAAAVFPLADVSAEPSDASAPKASAWRGALICEQYASDQFARSMPAMADSLAVHSAIALARSERTTGRTATAAAKWLGWRRQLLLGMTAIAVIALVVIPAPLRTAARGKLLPTRRFDVFAHVDGTVQKVLAEHAQPVEAGQVLAELESTDLAVQISETIGQRDKTLEQLAAREQLMLQSNDLSAIAQQQLAGEILELKQILTTLEMRLELQQEKQRQLLVRSPIRGQVVTWNVEDTLLRRPVRTGQVLMSVIDPEGPWELEIYVPERRFGQLLDAMRASSERLEVHFRVHSQSGQEFIGHVVDYHRLAEMHGSEGNCIALRVEINKDEIPQLHPEATVSAQITCGTRSLGRVLFQDVLETAHNAWLYWF